MIKITNVNYSVFGNCLQISNGKVIVRVTTDIGPRIIYFGGIDEDNMMYTDIKGELTHESDFLEKNYGKGEIWRNYGGHRLWKSPEDEATYQPDHNPVEVVLCENGATFYSGDDKITGIRKGVKVTMSEAGDVTIEHTFFNCGKKTLRVALWGLSVMNQNSIAVIPMSKENTGYLANRNLVLWHYADVKDERLTIEQNYISVRQTPNCKGPIKIGTLNTEGIVYYIRNNKLVEKICDKADRNGNYVDYSCSTEIYSCKDFIEVENLSELYDIPVGAEASYKEVWKLHIEDKLYDSIKKMINEK